MLSLQGEGEVFGRSHPQGKIFVEVRDYDGQQREERKNQKSEFRGLTSVLWLLCALRVLCG